MDYYDEEDDTYWYDDEEAYGDAPYFSLSSYTIWDLWEDCLWPSLFDGFSASRNLLLTCLLLRITFCLVKIPKTFAEISVIVAGAYCLYHFFEFHSLFVLLLIILGITTLSVLPKNYHYGLTNSIVCLTFILACELFIVEKSQWHKVRGSQMVLAMKIISLAFDVERGSNSPTLSELSAYFMSPATLIFGPWIKYQDHHNMMNASAKKIFNVFAVFKLFILCAIFLSLSTCWLSWLISDQAQFAWLLAYRDAFSFRCSHYFICFLSQLTLTLLGSEDKNVSSPWPIEVPRSLVEVVVHWNMPMHSWLKHYVFRTARPMGNLAAILFTYSASAILHGLNFQLAAVLLSLGFYTYGEYVLRNKFATIFSACIEARSCPTNCGHNNNKYSWGVILFNAGFVILSVFHLAYLGVMFDSSSTLQEEGYSMEHTLSKWQELGFASHWVALLIFIFQFFV